MPEDLIAVASIRINARAPEVWNALVSPAANKEFMFGATVSSDWQEGHPITWRGDWQGKSYEDKGVILHAEPPRVLEYTHYSPLTGKPDVPANYHTVTIELIPDGSQTAVTITQDSNETREARVHSEKNWATMLSSLKKLIESVPWSREAGAHAY